MATVFSRTLALCLVIAALSPLRASAANILFVSDNGSEPTLSSLLMSDGHDVTIRNRDFSGGMNPALRDDLAPYDVVVWIANGDGFGSFPHTDVEAFGNLTDYVENGGRVFVTGYGSLSGRDTSLMLFLGGTASTGYTDVPGIISDLDTSLTNGPYDIRGVSPTAYDYEYEGLTSLASDTIAILDATDTGFGGRGTQWSLRTLGSGEIAFVAAGQPYSPGSSSSAWSGDGASSGGAYTSAIRNFIASAEGAASEPGAPQIRFTSRPSADEGDALTVGVDVTDAEGDTVMFSWDLDGDGVYGESAGMDEIIIAAGVTDGPGSFRIGVEATDGVHTSQRARSVRILNVAPEVLSAPPTVVAIAQRVNYHIVVADPGGAADPLTFELVAGPPSALVTTDGTFQWTPTESEVTAAGTSTTVTVEITDGDMGTTRHTWEVRVLNDHAPTDPSPQFPTLGIAILDTQPRLVVADSVDLDDDDLTYYFEVDRAETFDTEELQASEGVPETPVLTEWTPPTPLTLGTWYWRVWVSDGIASTVPVVSQFVVVPDPTMIPDAGPSDGGVDAATVVDTRPRGCSCSVPASHGSRSALGALAVLALSLGLGRRRSRRR